MEEKDRIENWVDNLWICKCGALNAGWLDNCGRCDKQRYEEN